jgi:SAM-dependent methyltransferase
MEWHKRFVQQATWTNDLRTYLLRCAGIESAHRILEVGCGTGAILSTLTTAAAIHGLDLDYTRLVEARLHVPQAVLTSGDALSLPYVPDVFDITFCHFLLLWVKDPLQALQEMKRVTRPGGSILALAEPDYNGRVDKPDVLAPLGRLQAQSLQRQGAATGLGKRLTGLFHQAGIPLIQTGTLQPEGKNSPTPEEWALEWAVLEADLAGTIPAGEFQRLKHLDQEAWERGERVLYVPTYFAWGQATQMV